MPAKPRWYNKLRRIRAAVEALDSPLLDRAALEKLFGVRARAAQLLMRQLGAHHQLGNALVVERGRVIEFLEATGRGEAYVAEHQRRQRVRDALQEAQLEASAHRVRFPVQPQAGLTIAGLPDTIRLSPGELRVTCKDATDLLQQLFQLSRAVAKDFAVFEERLK